MKPSQWSIVLHYRTGFERPEVHALCVTGAEAWKAGYKLVNGIPEGERVTVLQDGYETEVPRG